MRNSTKMLGEDKVLRRILRQVPALQGAEGGRDGGHAQLETILGIGDDAAEVACSPVSRLVLSCDWSLEGVHFLRSLHPPDAIGYRSLARATSDLAAMGATPRWFLLSLAMRGRDSGTWLQGFARGLGRAARAFGMRLIGGDTARHERIAVSITVMGEARRARTLRRDSAKPGDTICVTGTLGQAALGFELLRRNKRKADGQAGARFISAHLYPRIELKLGQWLAERELASAAMDISDGFSTDLARLCAASGVGARVWADRIPRVRLPASLGHGGIDTLALALHGGDDYGLLFTVSPRLMGRLRRAPSWRQIACIGEITKEREVLLLQRGKSRALKAHGWQHFP